MALIGIVAIILASTGIAGFMYNTSSEGLLVRVGGSDSSGYEGFSDARPCNKCGAPSAMCGCKKSSCNSCGKPKSSCECSGASSSKCAPVAPCPRVMEPDLSKYILKSQIPTCNRAPMPDMSNYMLKTECPPVPDLSKYVLKSSIPKQQPVILDCSKCKKPSGECPPCPRPRCPEVKCPEPTKCAPCAPCARQSCPPAVVKCKAEEVPNSTVRPYLAPLSFSGFGLGL